MRVAYICADPGVPVFGRKGCSVHAQEVIRALAGHGADVELFAARPDGPPRPGLDGIVVRRLPCPAGPDAAARERAAIAANVPLREELDRAGPFDLVYERYSLFSYAGMEYARDEGTPGILEVNSPLIDEQETFRVLVDRRAAEAAAGRAFRAASALVAVSEGVAEWLRRQGAEGGRIHVVPNGVDPGRFPEDAVPLLPAPPGVFTVGFVGTLKEWHGLPQLVEAFRLFHARAPASRLLVVGDGPGKDGLAAGIAAAGIAGAVVLRGAAPPEEIPGLLASMDVAVAPYPPLEPFYFSPLKVFEYMAAGRPVAASRIGQIACVIRDGETGILLPPGDVAALAAALERLFLDPALRARLGRAARAAIARDRTWAAVGRRILAVAGYAPSGCPVAGGT